MPKLSVLIDARPAQAGAQAVSVAVQRMSSDVRTSASAVKAAEEDVARTIRTSSDSVIRAEDDIVVAVTGGRRKRAASARDLAAVERQALTDLLSGGAQVKALEEDMTRTVVEQTRKRTRASQDGAKSTTDLIRQSERDVLAALQSAKAGAGNSIAGSIRAADADLESLITKARKLQTVQTTAARPLAFSTRAVSRLETEASDTVARAFTQQGTASIASFIAKAEADVNAAVQRAKKIQTVVAPTPPRAPIDVEALRRQAAAAELAARQVANIGDVALSRLGPAGNIVRALTGEVGGLERGLEKAALQSGLTSTSLLAIGAGAAGVLAVGGALAFAVTKGVELERSLDQVRGRIDPTKAGFDQLRDAALRLSSVSGIDRLQVSAALNETLISGYSRQADVLNVLTAATELARTKQIDLSAAVRVIDANLDVYGRTAADAAKTSEQLFVGARKGEVDLQSYAAALAEVGKTGAPLGIKLEELAAILSTTSPTVGASESVSGLSRLLLVLQNDLDPTNKRLRALGVDASAAGVRARGLISTLEDISTAIKSTGDETEVLTQLFGSPRLARVAFAAVGEGAARTRENLRDLTAELGEIAKANDRIDESSTKKLFDAYKTGLNVIVDLGADIAEGFASAALAAAGLGDEIDKLVARKAPPPVAFSKVTVDTGAFVKQQEDLQAYLLAHPLETSVGFAPIDTSAIDALFKDSLFGVKIDKSAVDALVKEFTFGVKPIEIPVELKLQERIDNDLGRLLNLSRLAPIPFDVAPKITQRDSLQREIDRQLSDLPPIGITLGIEPPLPADVQAARAVLASLRSKPEAALGGAEKDLARINLEVLRDYNRAQQEKSQLTTSLSAQIGTASQREVTAQENARAAVLRKIATLERESGTTTKLTALRALASAADRTTTSDRADKLAREELSVRQGIFDLEVRIADKRAEQLRGSDSPSDARAAIAADLLARELSISASADKASDAIREQLKNRQDLSGELETQLGLINAQASIERELARTTARRANIDLTRAARANNDALEQSLLDIRDAGVLETRDNRAADLAKTLTLQEQYARALQGSTDNLDEQLTASSLLREAERTRLTSELDLLTDEKTKIAEILALYDKQTQRERTRAIAAGTDRRRRPGLRNDDELADDTIKELTAQFGELDQSSAAFLKNFDRLFTAKRNLRDIVSTGADSLQNELNGVLDGTTDAAAGVQNLGRAIQREIIDRLVSQPLSDAFAGLFGKLLGGIGFPGSGSGGGGESTPGGQSALGNVFDPSGHIPFARGDVFRSNEPQRFARGDLFDAPTRFGFGAGKVGVLGEAGPEAIMPLKRGAGGKLGVEASGGGGQTNVTNNYNTVTTRMVVNTPNADTFRKSQRQIISDMRRAARGRG